MSDYSAGTLATASTVGTPLLAVRKDTPAADPKASANLEQSRPNTDSGGNLRVSQEGGKTTYRATSQFACDSTATDIWVLAGNATTTVKVLYIKVTSTATAAAVGDLTLIRRTAADTAGTAVSATLGILDGRDAAPASTPQHYTAHPTSLGAAATAPNLGCERLTQGTAAVVGTKAFFDFRDGQGARGGLRLSGTTDILALNAVAGLGGSGNAWDIEVGWVEEPTTA